MTVFLAAISLVSLSGCMNELDAQGLADEDAAPGGDAHLVFPIDDDAPPADAGVDAQPPPFRLPRATDRGPRG